MTQTSTHRCPTPLPVNVLDSSSFDRLHHISAAIAGEAATIDGIGGTERATNDQLADLMSRAQHAMSCAYDVLQVSVDAARDHGMSWQQIGDAFGMSRQAAHERFA